MLDSRARLSLDLFNWLHLSSQILTDFKLGRSRSHARVLNGYDDDDDRDNEDLDSGVHHLTLAYISGLVIYTVSALVAQPSIVA